MILLAGKFRRFVVFASVAVLALLVGPVAGSQAQKVDGMKGLEATKPVNLQMTPSNAFVRIRGWSLPAPILPLALMGSWGGRGTVSGAGQVNIPVGEISQPQSFEFPRDINGEEEQMKVSLSARSDWTGSVDPLTGAAEMSMPMTLRIEASHVRMVDIPWPGGWIYGNIDCTVGLDFGPMTTGRMEPPVPDLEIAPVTEGKPYDPATGAFDAINNSMSIGGFSCSRPDIGSGQVEDELNGAVAIPSAPGTTDALFNLTFLEGGDVVRPQPAIRPAFSSTPATPGAATLDAGGSHAAAGVSSYEWDFDGDGNPDASGADPVVTHDFGAPGSYPVALRVTDADGDVSGWSKADVSTGTETPIAAGALRVMASGPKKARAGSKVNVRVKVRNESDARATKVVACAARACRMIGTIPAGQTKKIKLSPRLGKKARGRVGLKVKARGRGAEPGSARVVIKVKRVA